MITKEASTIVHEDEKSITYQFNKPIYDERGWPTWTYDDSIIDRVTVIKHPLFDKPYKPKDDTN